MRYALTEEQGMLVAAVRRALEERAGYAVVRGWLDAGDHLAPRALMAEGGWLGVGVALEDGGEGGGFAEAALVAEELGRAAFPSGSWTAATLAAPFLAGEPELPAVLDSAAGAAVALPAGAPPVGRGPALPALLEGPGGPRVRGRVARVLAADLADHLVVPVVEAGGESAVVLVATASDGVRVEPRALLDRSRTLADVVFADAPARRLAPPPGTLAALGPRAAVLTAADALGAAQRLLEMTVAYTLQRRQFGAPIGSFQAVKHAAAGIVVELEPVRSVVRHAAWSIAAGHPEAELHACVAKAQATAAAVRVADTALTLHGAIGFTWEHDLQLLFKRAQLDRELFGAPDAWTERTADLLALSRPVKAGCGPAGGQAAPTGLVGAGWAPP